MIVSTRRATIGAAASALFVGASRPSRAAAPDEIAAIEQRSGGRIGVFAVDTGSGRILGFRADERFPTESTFKAPLAAAVLARIDRGADRPGAVVRFDRTDLVEASPVTGAEAANGAMTVDALLQAVLVRSDNTGANLLMRRIGGPPALDRFLRSIGDHVTDIVHYEPVDGGHGKEDTTTPRAMASTMRTVVLGDVLSPTSRRVMIDAMARNVPGRTRLRASFPPDWRVVDRTGTGNGICNDVAIAWRPNRAPLVVAVYQVASGAALETQETTMRAVGRAVAAWNA